MAKGNRPGQAGQGSRAARGAGLGSKTPGFMNRVLGGRLGLGRGDGSGGRPRAGNISGTNQDPIDQLRLVREQLNEIEKDIFGKKDNSSN